jgi:diaminohydroxyphosphoribosylaminopyrimidine deaminase/5-amino-6-(5-phosphoribosylamino)uracil reductase
VNEVLAEGGGGLAAALVRARLADRLALFVAPIALGADARPAFGPLGVRRLARAPALARLRVRRLGRDVLLEGEW